uniref:Uncharacterized protein n=1 Tax=Ananas comosus var. bracteatus TaxID=296719 RepID=A0A6V7NMP3_ANACO|nr:unnamed protein product [Ananas comosus var. bracteatus]
MGEEEERGKERRGVQIRCPSFGAPPRATGEGKGLAQEEEEPVVVGEVDQSGVLRRRRMRGMVRPHRALGMGICSSSSSSSSSSRGARCTQIRFLWESENPSMR